MGNRNDLENLLEILKSISGKRLRTPHHVPVEAAIQEAHDLYHWTLEDKEPLTGAGLDWQLVENLPPRIGALVEAQARWITEKNTGTDTQTAWADQSRAASQLRDRLRRQFRFAFEEHPHLSVHLKEKGIKHTDLIQELNDLSLLGKENKEPLEATGFDLSLLDLAAQTAEESASLLAQITAERQSGKEAKIIRDQAYSYLKEAVDEIRRRGQHVFHGNKRRLQGYRSKHIRDKKNEKRNKGEN